MGPLNNSEEEFIKKWEDIIDAVDKTSFPIRFVRSVSFEASSNSKFEFKKTIEIEMLRKEGYDDDSIQEIITDALLEFPDNEGEMEFELDIEEVAHIAGEITSRYLQHC